MLIEHYYVLEDTKKKKDKIPWSKFISRVEGGAGEIKHLPYLCEKCYRVLPDQEERMLNFLAI